jgi:hypothetical protein
MISRKFVHAMCGAVMVALVAGTSIGAAPDHRRMTYLTFNRPVSVPGVTLGAGAYTFEIANPDSTGDVVRVMSRDRSRLYWSGFTRLVQRPAGMKLDQLITFSEAPAHSAPPINAWYFQNENIGRQFIY